MLSDYLAAGYFAGDRSEWGRGSRCAGSSASEEIQRLHNQLPSVIERFDNRAVEQHNAIGTRASSTRKVHVDEGFADVGFLEKLACTIA